MIKTPVFSLFRYNKFTFGDQIVSQFVIFELKFCFSLIVFYFHKSQGEQDRYHTHAFNALSIKLFGEYNEYILDNEKTGEYHIDRRNKTFKYFPRNSYHKIGNSTGCCTILISGPWKKNWKEYINGKVVHYSWGRQTNKKLCGHQLQHTEI
jgi:hypothetical protein